MFLKAKLIALGAAILSGLAFFVRFQSVKNQRDKARLRAEIAEAQVHQQKIRNRIIKEGKEKYVSRRVEIMRELEKEEEEFKGIPSLTDPNSK